MVSIAVKQEREACAKDVEYLACRCECVHAACSAYHHAASQIRARALEGK